MSETVFIQAATDPLEEEYEVHIEMAEEGRHVVTCPALPGCVSEGETREEAIANMKDAIGAYLTVLRKHGLDELKHRA